MIRGTRILAAVIAGVPAAASAGQPEMSAGRDCIEVGWQEAMCEAGDDRWRSEAWQSVQPDDRAITTRDADGCRFRVPSPDRVGVWTRTTNPIWVQSFPFLVIEHGPTVSARTGSPQILLFDDSTGPITPNALNPENPQAGQHEAILGPLSAEAGTEVFDLRGLYPSDRVARISLRLASGDRPASVLLKRVAFRARDPRTPAAGVAKPATRASLPPSSAAADAGSQAAWQPIDWPSASAGTGRAACFIAAELLAEVFGSPSPRPAEDNLRPGEIEFHLGDPGRAALGTGIAETGEIELSGRWRGSELALLLTVRMFGNEAPWYAPGPGRPRLAAHSPHQLTVRLAYGDGTTESHFPWCPETNAYRVDGRPRAVVVPLQVGKPLTRIIVRDDMTYGQVFLLGASVRVAGRPLSPVPAPIAAGARSPASGSAPVVSAPMLAAREGDTLRVETAGLRLLADIGTGFHLRRLDLVGYNRTIARAGLLEAGAPLALVKSSHPLPDQAGLVLEWSVGDPGANHVLCLRVSDGGNGGMVLQPVLRNGAGETWCPPVRWPCLGECTVSPEPADAWYLVGTDNTMLSNEPVSVTRPYGSPWPLPLIDLFAPAAGGGLAIWMEDEQLLSRVLEFKQAAGRADLSVRFDELQVRPGEALRLPAVHLVPHRGDWHEGFADYRRAAQRRWPAPLPSALAGAFYCRRDYPLGGTGLLFDASRRVYTPDQLGAESQEAFGGLDMIDISGWAYHEKTGRVGDYLTNDLGGLDELKRAAAAVHARGGRLGLYFEGYLVDRRCPLAARALPAWQIVRRDGKPMWWSGDMELFVCPGVRPWQAELSQAIAQVAAFTGADAVYVDEFGYAEPGKACWSPGHGHPVPSNPLAEERAMLDAVRRALAAQAPGTALYIEFVPADGLAGRVDAAFDLGISGDQPGRHPTKLPLYRYVFPGLASFQMVSHGIRPVPFEADDLHRCVFHGMGIWLKGRGESWFTPGFRDLARQARRLFADYGRVFRSPDCEPLLPTLRPELYANRFSAGGETIYTLYNAGGSTLAGDLLSVPFPPDTQVRELLGGAPAELRPADGNAATVLRGRVEPGSVAVFLVRPAAGFGRR